jgi:hypothetical protein
VALVQRMTAAYLHSALGPADPAWSDATQDLTAAANPLGRVESK